MVRLIAFLAGIFFAGMMLYSFVRGGIDYVANPPAETIEEAFHQHPKHVSFSFDGPFGKYDHAQLQRGFQVYKEVCSACHSLKHVAFRDLQGIGYSEGQVKTIASEWTTEQPSLNAETGEPATRKNIAADFFPAPFANETAARAANNNALPPDLSLMAKARHSGSRYIYSLLTGFQDQPAEVVRRFGKTAKTPEGLHYNPYFANLNIAMAPPLTADGQVVYGEGAPKATKDQMARDVSAFLSWTAEPKLENRNRAGIPVIIFLLLFTFLCFQSYKLIWADKKH